MIYCFFKIKYTEFRCWSFSKKDFRPESHCQKMIIKIAATQFEAQIEKDFNVAKAEIIVRKAVEQGANVVLLQELFESLYWCQEQDPEYFSWSSPASGNPLIDRFSKLAAELNVVIPVSFFERAGNVCYNSVAMLDADGSNLGVYRKSHIPTGPGYNEKFYFAPGDTGFKVFSTRFGRLGLAICWDQWFPEAARIMALQGAEVLLYPTAIGSEPHDPSISSYAPWVRAMQGHAAANMVPVVASNRIGTERFKSSSVTFYGGSFVCDHEGGVIAQVGARNLPNGNADHAPEPIEGFCVSSIDLGLCSARRLSWGIFRDRRPDLYAGGI